MKIEYRVSVVGKTPKDIVERISNLHAICVKNYVTKEEEDKSLQERRGVSEAGGRRQPSRNAKENVGTSVLPHPLTGRTQNTEFVAPANELEAKND